MKSCVVIYNPNSGHTLKTKHLKEYKIILEKHGYSISKYESEKTFAE